MLGIAFQHMMGKCKFSSQLSPLLTDLIFGVSAYFSCTAAFKVGIANSDTGLAVIKTLHRKY